jgi:molecular chaperone GrpE
MTHQKKPTPSSEIKEGFSKEEHPSEKPVLEPKASLKTYSETEYLELKDLLQRTQANFENYRKQAEKRMEDFQKLSSRDIILQLLPLLDNFELALKNCRCPLQKNTLERNTSEKDSSLSSEFLKGMELIYSQFYGFLENNGIHPIISEGSKFDPRLHEALLKVPSDYPENTVVEELQKGFTLNGNLIRPARVKISLGKK